MNTGISVIIKEIRDEPQGPDFRDRQLSLLWDSDASKQLGEPGVGAQWVPECLNLNVGETIEALLAGFFEPPEGLILVFQPGINEGKGKSRSKAPLRNHLELVQDPKRLISFTQSSMCVPKQGEGRGAASGQL